MPLLGTRGSASAKAFGLTAGIGGLDVDYLVVAGGGSAQTGAGGAGGYRTSFPGGTKIKLINGVTVPITVGAGAPASPTGADGVDSVFSTITSTAGGGASAAANASPGGSGGGGGYDGTNRLGGTGNSPPTSPPQGNNGGNGEGYSAGCEDTNGGGGGASSAGQTITGSPLGVAGAGGNGAGVPTSFVPASYGTPGPSPTVRYFSGGGGGGSAGSNSNPAPQGGYGGGGNGQRFGRSAGCGIASPPAAGQSGTVNTGGGGGGGFDRFYSGGSGIVLVHVPSSDASKENFTLAPGTNTLVTNGDGSKTAVFTVSGTIQQN